MMAQNISSHISHIRQQLGNKLTVVGHHYQSDSVIQHTDMRGDSLELARKVAAVDSQYIVFCGVYFMAESAALLVQPGQHVFLPDLSANCSMAQMAPASLVDTVLAKLNAQGRKVVPLAYVNTSLAVKTVVGAYGGAVCTSANASTMLSWAMNQGDAVLFLPDKNLGNNTANQLGIDSASRAVINIQQQGALLDVAGFDDASLLLWPGLCSIHARFSLRQITAMRSAYPGVSVVVHPECAPDVVDAADAAGSTSFIIRYVADAPKGSVIAVGTELNLVKRLADAYADRVTVLPLTDSVCSHMAKITEANLLTTLQDIVTGNPRTEVVAPEAGKADAKASLDRMLAVCS